MKGSCGNETKPTEQNILIEWNAENQNHNINMTFKLNETSGLVSLNELKIIVGKTLLPNATDGLILYHNKQEFNSSEYKSYHCTRNQYFPLSDLNSTVIIGEAIFSHTQVEAFRKSKTAEFSTAIDCDAVSPPGNCDMKETRSFNFQYLYTYDYVTGIVPIAVGIALIALVVIVLIAYVVGRRRTRAAGYMSM